MAQNRRLPAHRRFRRQFLHHRRMQQCRRSCRHRQRLCFNHRQAERPSGASAETAFQHRSCKTTDRRNHNRICHLHQHPVARQHSGRARRRKHADRLRKRSRRAVRNRRTQSIASTSSLLAKEISTTRSQSKNTSSQSTFTPTAPLQTNTATHILTTAGNRSTQRMTPSPQRATLCSNGIQLPKLRQANRQPQKRSLRILRPTLAQTPSLLRP